ncbi:MAG: aspartate/glutamate racemase family protein [Microgenomates group bacterium]
MDTSPIIVFDSGIGGMSIYKPLRLALPNANIIYIADTDNFPYGDKSSAWLASRFAQLGKQFASLSPRLVVLACNSATTNIIADLRKTLDCPVVGVEPVIKPLSVFTHSLALMTTVSAQSETTKQLLKKYGDHITIFTPHGLAVAIEYNDFEQVEKNIHEIKNIVQAQKIEAIGLSCTHYPLILNRLQAAMPSVKFIDPSQAVVKEVMRVLESSQL